MARFNQFEEGKKYYAAQPHMVSALPAAVSGIKKLASAEIDFAKNTGIGKDFARNKQRSMLSSKGYSPTEIKNVRDAGNFSSKGTPKTSNSVTTPGAMSAGASRMPSIDTQDMLRRKTGASDQFTPTLSPSLNNENKSGTINKTGNTVYTNIKGGGHVGDIDSFSANGGMAKSIPSKPANSPKYEVSNSSWSKDELDRFSRQPARPAQNQRVMTARQSGGSWHPDYQGSRFSTEDSMPKFSAPGMKGKARQNSINIQKATYLRERRLASDKMENTMAGQEGQTERAQMGNENALTVAGMNNATSSGNVAARNENDLKIADKRITGASDLERQRSENDLKIADKRITGASDLERQRSDFVTGRDKSLAGYQASRDESLNEMKTNRDRSNNAFKAYTGGVAPGAAEAIQFGNPDYSQLPKVAPKVTSSGELSQGEAAKGMQKFSSDFTNYMATQPGANDWTPQQQQSAFMNYINGTGQSGLYSKYMRRLGM